MKWAFGATAVFGLLLALSGVIWALQGFGMLGGSPMSNTTTWSVIGPITALIGIGVAAFGWRKFSAK